jgi:hypothetical protein
MLTLALIGGLSRKPLLLFTVLAACPLAAQTLSFVPQTIYAGHSPTSVRLFDFNGDHKPDIVVINAGGWGTVTVLLNEGGGNFSDPITTFTGGTGAVAVISGDYNHDGKADLAVVNTTTCRTTCRSCSATAMERSG